MPSRIGISPSFLMRGAKLQDIEIKNGQTIIRLLKVFLQEIV